MPLLTVEYVVLPSFHPPIAINSLTFGFEVFRFMKRLNNAKKRLKVLIEEIRIFSQKLVTSRVQKFDTSVRIQSNK